MMRFLTKLYNFKNYRFFAAASIICCLVFAGCTTTPKHYIDPLSLPKVSSWSLIGKIAVQYPNENCRKDDCRPQSDQGGIRWTQTPTTYHIVISDPFGKVITTITGNYQVATIRDGKATHTVSPTQMLEQVLHMPVRLPTVTQWVTGRPDNRLAKPMPTREGFIQNKVTIEPSLWRNINELGKMPSKVIMRAGDNEIRLVVKQWRLHER